MLSSQSGTTAMLLSSLFEGEIDDVAVYHRALDDKEVMENYQIAFDVQPAAKLALTWGAIKTY